MRPVTPQVDMHKAESGARGWRAPSPAPHSFSLCQHQSHLSEGCGCRTGAAPHIGSRHWVHWGGRSPAARPLWLCPSRLLYTESQGSLIRKYLQIHKLVWNTPAGINATSLRWTWRCIPVLAPLLCWTDTVHGPSPQLYKKKTCKK